MSVVKKAADASRWDDMNSGDNLIPIGSVPRDLNEFNLEELKEPEVKAFDANEMKKVPSGRRT